jgi:hypothetical protein
LNLLREQILKVEEALRSNHIEDVILIDSNVINFNEWSSSVVLHTDKTTFFGYSVQLQYFSTGSKKVSGILKKMESNEIAAEQTF